MSTHTKRVAEHVGALVDKGKEQVGEYVERGRSLVGDQSNPVAAAVEAGREAYRTAESSRELNGVTAPSPRWLAIRKRWVSLEPIERDMAGA